MIKCNHCGRMGKGIIWKKFAIKNHKIIRLDDELLPLCNECFEKISMGELN